MTNRKQIHELRLILRRYKLHLRAQRGQPYIVERLTDDYILTGFEVERFNNVDELYDYVLFIDNNHKYRDN